MYKKPQSNVLDFVTKNKFLKDSKVLVIVVKGSKSHFGFLQSFLEGIHNNKNILHGVFVLYK